MKKINLLLLFSLVLTTVYAQESKINLVIGTYTNRCESKGIYVYNFDTETGDFSLKSTSEGVISPSYLTVSKENDCIYSVNQNGSASTVSAFEFDAAKGRLQLINQQKIIGSGPCYIINDDKNVIVANYSSGNINVFGINKDKSLTEVKQVVQHVGKSSNPQRQEGPHAHMVYFSPDKKYVLAADLGTDKVYSYSYLPLATKEILKLNKTLDVKAGSGPRHLISSKNGKYVYLLQELDGSLTAYKYKGGSLTKIEETSVLSADFKGAIGAADIHISPDGHFLYATNRGDANDISCFKILKTGKLLFVDRMSTKGKTPRNFSIDPTGNFLLVGNQDTNNVVVFKRDKVTGKLTDTGKRIELCSPACLVFTKE